MYVYVEYSEMCIMNREMEVRRERDDRDDDHQNGMQKVKIASLFLSPSLIHSLTL